MIEVEAVSKYFHGKAAVDEISFQARDKEILVLLGTSGCGKTTTLKMINRLIEPDSGRILIDGKNTAEQKAEELRMNIGFVMQHAGLFPHYTVRQNIAVVPQLLKWNKNEIRRRTEELTQKLHLSEELLSRYPHELSGGQQQRVGIARALIANTPVLLMDEPFGALDNITKADIHTEFKSLEEIKNKTIILVTHDVQEAFELGHKICVMDRGKILQTGSTREILYHPANDFVRDFFSKNRLLLEYKIARLENMTNYIADLPEICTRYHLKTDQNVWETLQTLSAGEGNLHDYEKVVQGFNDYRKQYLQ